MDSKLEFVVGFRRRSGRASAGELTQRRSSPPSSHGGGTADGGGGTGGAVRGPDPPVLCALRFGTSLLRTDPGRYVDLDCKFVVV